MTRWKVTIEYDGTGYAGWQKQDGVPTVQEELEQALYAFCQQNIRVHGAGRTDSGVHAAGQVAHLDIDYGDRALSGFELMKALNAHLRPQPVAVVHAEEADTEFHARYHAKNKLYRYRIINRRGFLALDRHFAWHMKRPLDAKAMHTAAQVLVGHHDFTTFRDSNCQAKSPERTLERLDVSAHTYDEYDGVEIRIEAEAQSFLHHQMRNIAGTLALVGEGKWSAEDVRKALDAKDRTQGGPTAPAHGLCLVRIDY